MPTIRLVALLAIAWGCSPASKDSTITCPVGAAYCASGCSNLATDAANCGACGSACAAGLQCVGGSCTAIVDAPCDGGLRRCAGLCVDLRSDRDNCGACGTVCSVHFSCIDAACALQCQADLVRCGAACVNIATDAANCGACGHVCPAGTGCTAGTCQTGAGCGAGLTWCAGVCVDTATDVANCGACGHACPGGATCQAGSCVASCSGTLISCAGVCVDLATDPANCGACGNACDPGASCSAGGCACPGGRSSCGPVAGCVDLSVDPANCGACGNACANGQVCAGGTCGCAPGSAVCGLVACNDLATDGDNCGACGIGCPAGQTCVAGTCAADASAFRMLGGDARHSGLNPGETGTPPLSQAWVARGAGGGSPPVIEGGRVFAIGGSRVHAVQASNGAELWSYNFGQVYGGIGWPAVSDAKVYVATSNNYGDTWLRELDRATGSVQFKVPFGSQWERYWSPIVAAGAVYLDGGTYGGLYGFGADSGAQLFFQPLEQYDEWSPAFFGGKVYTFVEGRVRAHDPVTGAVLATNDVGWTWSGWSMRTAPAFGDTYGYVISPPNLYAFAPDTLNTVWTVNDSFVGYPVVADGVVYALGSGVLHAMDAATGARKWIFAGDDALVYPPVVAAGYVYVASAANVYAIRAATHAQVWTAPVGGALAIGSGMLVVSRASDASLVGFRLTP